MPAISRESLMSLETYAKARPQFRARVLEHKKHRAIALGSHITLIFEDELTIRYQIQEMLRAERTFEEDAIRAELDAYMPLVPDGSNWKATMMVEYPDPRERSVMLGRLIGIGDSAWVQVEGCARAYAVADEDMERENEVKTSSVHFLRFELTSSMISRLREGAALSVGIEHPQYNARVDNVDSITLASLMQDLSSGAA